MCGRFTLTQPGEKIAQTFGLVQVPQMTSRYNIAPTQQIATILQEPEQQARQLKWMRWGLIPRWAKDPAIGNRLINARSETLSEKPSFREAFKKRRCLVVADGFYEWKPERKRKQPYYIQMQDGQPFAFAGLWETWRGSEGEEIVSCTLITTAANSLMQPIHERMPVILPPDTYDQWLDSTSIEPEALQSLLQSYPDEAMKATAVNPLVNNPANEQPECISPLTKL